MLKLSSFVFLLIGISTSTGTTFECNVGNLLANWYCEDYCKSLNPGDHVAGSCGKDEVSCLCETSGNKTIIVRILQDQAPVPATTAPPPFVNMQKPLSGFPFQQQPVPQRLVCDGSTTATQMCNSFCINTKGARNGVCNLSELSCRCVGVAFISKDPIPDFFPPPQVNPGPMQFQRPVQQPQQQRPFNLNAQNPMQNVFVPIRQDPIPPQQQPSLSFPLRPPQTMNSFNSFQQAPNNNNNPPLQQQPLFLSSQQQQQQPMNGMNLRFNPAVQGTLRDESRPILNPFSSDPVVIEPTFETQTIANLPHDLTGFTLSPELENFNGTSTTESSTSTFEENSNNNDNLQNHQIIMRPPPSAPKNNNNSPPVEANNNKRHSFSK